MKRAKIQDIADLLNISRVTVWKVFNNKDGVSEDMKRKVLECAAELNYQPSKLQEVELAIPLKKQTLVSVVVSRPETSAFWVKIIHQLAEEFSNSGIGLMYTYLPAQIPEGYVLPQSLTDGSIQGIIIMNVYDEEMLQLLNGLSIPKVFLDIVTDMSVESLNGDLLLLEGRDSIKEIVTTLIKRGRKHIGFIGDIQYAKTNMERYEGYVSAMYQFGMPIEPNICYTGNMTVKTYVEIIEEFMNNIKQLPDAFVCVNDHAANMLVQYLESHGHQVPGDVAVSGYDDNNEFNYTKNLTTVQVNNSQIGKRLAKQLLYRIDNPEDPFEVTYIRTRVVYRNSTEI
ncbi:LacI family DNA-binding transcriptional regulator [Anaerocolumna chitinilytica]|uniref:LacI family transcriptional regulator n=1 Tax=Anaerocolumna chitinilytica TaxID=1727145 RepID=A0A7I8DQV8_9FIRM|nr:LacI family DNA-binding transcriptional regulator [Anaerocolumna chitinilytica]BCJ98676.1 LacI family transcriptional regulator [Anaerocolumna chitinilytica]